MDVSKKSCKGMKGSVQRRYMAVLLFLLGEKRGAFLLIPRGGERGGEGGSYSAEEARGGTRFLHKTSERFPEICDSRKKRGKESGCLVILKGSCQVNTGNVSKKEG